MGVADNRSYKNEYLFQDDRNYDIKEEQPSIHEEPRINSTIKENPYRSNVEIEGGEIVLQPDLTALFKAKGKKHSQGGMDVLLKPESFIFSDFKGLDFTKKDHELFELKEGGKNTPAEVLKRNVDIKHYNTMVSILDDPYKDDLSKKSAALMLEKYLQNLGNIAYIQEEKKGFPQGLPSFSVGTAPVYDPSIKQAIMENKQYMKAGGMAKNPYKMQQGSIFPDAFASEKERQRREILSKLLEVGKNVSNQANKSIIQNIYTPSRVQPTPQELPDQSIVSLDISTPNQTPRQDRYIGKRPPYPDTWTNYYDKTQNTQYNAPNWINPSTFYATPGLIDYMKTLDRAKGVDWDMNKADDAVWGWRHEAALKKFFPNGAPKAVPFNITPQQRDELLKQVGKSTNITPIDIPLGKDTSGPTVEDIEVTPQGSKRANWQFTPWQKLSQAYNWGQYAGVNRYMPFRSRYNATYVDPALVNPEQAIGDIKGLSSQQLSQLSTLSPILRNAQAAQLFGSVQSQIPGIRSQYDNQNAQILNQARMYNNQVKNNESLVNMGNDQQYYTQAVEGRKNFDNMRTYTANQAMNNVLRDVETNQKLAYNLLTQNQPAYNFDWRTGNFTRTNKSIMDVQSNAVNDRYSDMIQSINQISDPVERNKLLVKLEGLKIFGQAQQTSPVFKKGGKTKKNPY